MINLPQEYTKYNNISSTDCIYLVEIYTSSTDFIAISNCNVTIEGVQYIKRLNDISASTLSYDVYNNTIKVSEPEITITEDWYTDGTSTIETLYAASPIGRKARIYLGYYGITSKSGYLLIGEVTIEDIKYNGRLITLICSTPTVSDVSVSGGQISALHQTIGDTLVESGIGGVTIIDEVEGTYAPLSFGKHWAFPLVPIGTHIDALSIASSSVVYYPIDPYLTFFSSSTQYYNYYQYNIDRTEPFITIPNEGYMVPLHKQAWNNKTETNTANVYETGYISGLGCNALKVYTGARSYHAGTDWSMFVNVPLRHTFISGTFYEIDTNGGIIGNTDLITGSIYNGNYALNTPFILSGDNIGTMKVRWWSSINPDQLRSSASGSVFPKRLTSIAKTSAFNNGSTVLLGKIYANGNYDWKYTLDYFTDNYIFDNALDIAQLRSGSAYYLSGVELNNTNTLPDQEYIKNTRVYGYNTGSLTNAEYTVWTDTPTGTNTTNTLKYNGEDFVYSKAGELSNINRDAINKRLSVHNGLYTDTTAEVDIIKVYALSAGNIGGNAQDIYGYHGTGLAIASSSQLSTVPSNEAGYITKNPVEHIEAIMRGVLGINTINSASFYTASANWTLCFTGEDGKRLRDYSGFSILTPIAFNTFITEYLKYEPLMLYCGTDADYSFISYKPSYTENDIVGDLDYNDSLQFTMEYSSLDQVYSEIASVKTGYIHQLDAYDMDMRWIVSGSTYNHAIWDIRNTAEKNRYVLSNIDAKYTTYVEPDKVTYNGKYYSALTENNNIVPTNTTYWVEMIDTGNNAAVYASIPAWDSGTTYYGVDSENKSIAKYVINQYANRKRHITFETAVKSYMKYEIGDIVGVANCPTTLLGMRIRGFAGTTQFTTQYNGQDHYGAFMITDIKKDTNKTTIKAVQLVYLNAYDVYLKAVNN